jgi:hypothetical protein
MTTNDKTRAGGRRARPGTAACGFRHDINPARSAFLSRRLYRESSNPGFSLRFERDERFFAAARRSSPFAFLSQKTPKNVKADSTHIDERNPSQTAENNQSGYAPLDTLVSARAARNRERKIKGKTPPDELSSTGNALLRRGWRGVLYFSTCSLWAGFCAAEGSRRGWRTLRVAVPGR